MAGVAPSAPARQALGSGAPKIVTPSESLQAKKCSHSAILQSTGHEEIAITTLKIASIIIFLAPTLFSFTAFAREGFTTGADIPPDVLVAQDSVFYVYFAKSTTSGEVTTSKHENGTAFVIMEDSSYFYFATANHVIDGVCEKTCPGVTLFQKASRRVSMLTSNAPPAVEKNSLTFDKVEVVKSSQNPDLAIIRAEKRQDVKYSLKSLKFSNSLPKPADKLYLIGFPDLSLRDCHRDLEFAKDGTPIIADVAKRWSQGIYIDLYASNDRKDSTTEIWMATTVDVLGGNSGGPMFNVLGEVVGVLVDGRKGGCYLGNETAGKLSPQSFGVPWIKSQ